MQPYFVPYPGYFRLFAAADIVVMFDCVQFPRRGWVHRNRFATVPGESDWLTLPIAKAPRDALITDLTFSLDARERMDAALTRFPLLHTARKAHDPLMDRVLDLGGGDGNVATYLCGLVDHITSLLGLKRALLRSSSLGVDAELRGQERVIAICRQVGATHYVNPPGGRELYDASAFAAAGLELGFLSEYGGSMDSILSRLLSEPATAVSAEIIRETRVVP
jgi:hypothetical protein